MAVHIRRIKRLIVIVAAFQVGVFLCLFEVERSVTECSRLSNEKSLFKLRRGLFWMSVPNLSSYIAIDFI